ncbi:MAG: hypothetical protein EA400_02115 [Chromatiaceae bacterium]|nr:MAG: hypothetical protein EA400_02115 [Chromatiaceae bacterium]
MNRVVSWPQAALACCLVIVPIATAIPGNARGEQTAPTLATATVAEVLAVCTRGQQQGNTGAAAAACVLLTLPCDCQPQRAGPRRWCLPGAEPTDRAVTRVVSALDQHPWPDARADSVIAAILAELYPCPPP